MDPILFLVRVLDWGRFLMEDMMEIEVHYGRTKDAEPKKIF